MKKITGLMMLLAMVTACGTATDRSVKALNLATGEKKDFTSTDAIPDGWAPCPDDACVVPPTNVPCQNLGTAVCTANPDCRLKKLGCTSSGCVDPETPASSGSGSSEPSPGGTPGNPTDPNDPTDPTDPPVPPDCGEPSQTICDYACVPKTPLMCDELGNQGDCDSRSDCEWQQLACGMACPEGADCPPCDGGYCAPKAPPSCESLDQNTCDKRQDCEWAPGVCPMMCAIDEPDCGAPCKSFCQTKIDPPPPPTCLPIAPPPPFFCQNGQLLPKYDAQGCIVGFECSVACPEIAPVPPTCVDGKIVPVYDANGCLVGYKCEQDNTSDCQQLATDYAKTLAEARKCLPFSPTLNVQCEVPVDSNLACGGCTTYVNGSNGAAVQKLKDLQAKAQQAQCFFNQPCPAMACMAPSGATCQVDGVGGTTGTCVDNQPNF